MALDRTGTHTALLGLQGKTDRITTTQRSLESSKYIKLFSLHIPHIVVRFTKKSGTFFLDQI